jgi:hypothetical protein
VGVQRRRAHGDGLGDAREAERLEAVRVRDGRGGFDDGLRAQSGARHQRAGSAIAASDRRSAFAIAASIAASPTIVRDWAAGAGIAGRNGPNYEAELGCGPRHAVDLDSARGWLTDAANVEVEGLVSGPKFVVVRLPRAVNITTIGLDPSATCGMDRSTAVKAFTLQTRTSASAPWVTALVREKALPQHRLTTLRPSKGRRRVRFAKLIMRSNRHRRARDDGATFMAMSELTVRGSAAPR